MSCTIPRPLPKNLTDEEEWHSQANEENGKSGVDHYGRDISSVDDPIVEESGHAIRPQILDHGRRDENLAGHGLVAIDLSKFICQLIQHSVS